MKQLLYVYVPGFEYDSKGPLHIDAIRLDVTTGEIEKDTEGKITNSLPTYIYMASVNMTTGESTRLIKGNLIYRADTTDQSFVNGLYVGSPSENPVWTEEKSGRATHGYFYDFITTDRNSEQTHHVIGIHNTPDACKNVSNLNSQEHDGLFVVQIEELNTDLVLNFTFYSRIDSSTVSSNMITVGTLEGITKMSGASTTDSARNAFFNQENRSDFFNKYIEIGQWTLTYNPATSGVEEGSLSAGDIKVQYFNLKKSGWGTTSRDWELPVNAGFLVSDLTSQNKLVPGSDSHCVYGLYKYNSNTLMHEYDASLGCNTKVASQSTYGDYYYNFYGTFSEDWVSNYSSGNFVAASVVSQYDSSGVGYWLGWCPVNLYDITYSGTCNLSKKYTITKVDLTNFNYLYNTLPKVELVNVIDKSECVDTASDNKTALTCTFDSNCIDSLQYNVSSLLKYGTDSYIWDRNAWLTWSKMSDLSDGTNALLDQKGQTNSIARGRFTLSAQITLPGKAPVKVLTNSLPAFETYYFVEYLRSSSVGAVKNKSLSNYILKSESGRNNKSGSWYNSVFISLVHDSNSSASNKFANESILDGGSSEILLSGSKSEIEISLTASSFKTPMMLFAASYLDYDKGNATGTSYSSTSSCVSAQGKQFSINSSWKYHTPHYVNIALPSMWYINLSATAKQGITFPNVTNHQVVPILINENNGYNGKAKNTVNIDTTKGNLLDPNPTSTSEYEIERVLASAASNIKDNTEFDCRTYLTTSKTAGVDSTFCKEKRFIGFKKGSAALNTINISINNAAKELDLDPGLYILRVQTMYPKNLSDIKISGKIGGNTFNNSGRNNRWVFYVKDSCKFKLTSLTRTGWTFNKGSYTYYDMLSGIGLYKVDLSKSDTNTLILKSTYDAYIDSLTKNGSFINPSGHEMIYDYIIFPAAFCAKEDIEFCKRSGNYNHPLGSTVYNDYKNDYCTSIDDDPIYHYYNFHYLPDKAIYEVLAYYTIPSGNLNKLDTSTIEYINTDLTGKLGFLGSEIVRI